MVGCLLPEDVAEEWDKKFSNGSIGYIRNISNEYHKYFTDSVFSLLTNIQRIHDERCLFEELEKELTILARDSLLSIPK